MKTKVKRRAEKLAAWLDGQLLKLGITLGATKAVETLINTFVRSAAFKTVVWIGFLAAVILSYIFQDEIAEKTEEAVDKAQNNG